MGSPAGVTLLALSILLLATALPTPAAEYRLQVANLYEESFASFLKPGEFADGARGPGLDQLEASLDGGQVPRGALLYDRHLRPAREGFAWAFGSVPIRAEVQLGGFDGVLWDEARWEGTPGEQSVWVVTPTSRRPQELRRVALKGFGPLRQFLPYILPPNSAPYPAVGFPLNFLWIQAERGTAWQSDVSPVLALSEGIGAVIGLNTNRSFPDSVYLIVRHGEQPTTYKAVLAWRQRREDIETPRIIPRRHR